MERAKARKATKIPAKVTPPPRLAKPRGTIRATLVDLPVTRADFECTVFKSPDSLLGFSVVILDLQHSFASYMESASTFQGLPSLTEGNSKLIASDCARRRGEIQQALSEGATVFVLVPGSQQCYIDTGERRYSGTGRNQKTTRIVSQFDMFDALNLGVNTRPARGKAMTLTTHSVAIELQSVADELYHESVLEGEGISPLAYITGTKAVIAAVKKVGAGHLVLLPRPKEKEGASGAEPAWLTQYGAFLSTLLRVHAVLTAASTDVLPEWAATVCTSEELERRAELTAKLRAAADANEEVERANVSLRSLESRKLLLTANGKSLERAVAEVLVRFGFEVTRRDDSRTDLILTYADRTAVGEVKGLTGSAREKDATQLEKWVTIHHDETGVEPKGLLIVNSFREVPIFERTAITFPEQMLPYATKKELCLVTTAQLFVADVVFSLDPDRVRRFCNALFDCSGIASMDFTDLHEVLHEVPTASLRELD